MHPVVRRVCGDSARGRAAVLAATLTRTLLVLLLCLAAPIAGAWQPEQWMAVAQKAGPRPLAMAKALADLIARASALDEASRLKPINQFFDRNIRYAEDIDTWGVPDYWASPLELLTKGQGDCEDYVIAKYFSLIAAGVPSDKLRLVYVRAQIGGATMYTYAAGGFAGNQKALQLQLQGPDANVLARLGDEIADSVRATPGAVDVLDAVHLSVQHDPAARREPAVRVHRGRAARRPPDRRSSRQ